MYKYTLEPSKEKDGEKIRFLGKVEAIDRYSGIFVLNNEIEKISCILKDKEMIRDIREGDIIRVFGRIVVIEEPEIYVDFFQKLPSDFDIRKYNKILRKLQAMHTK